VAIATQLGTWPLTAFGFLVLEPFAPIANAVVVPVVGIAMVVGFAAILASPIPALSHAIANVAIALVDWIATVVRIVSQLPNAHIIATPPPVWAIVSYDMTLVGLAVALGHGRFKRAALLGVVCTAALCLWPPRAAMHGLIITAIDVGQADSLLIQTPNGHAFLVDGGGRLENGSQRGGNSQAENIGERFVVPYLIRHGIHHLDVVILSHPHGDHEVIHAQDDLSPNQSSSTDKSASAIRDIVTSALSSPVETTSNIPLDRIDQLASDGLGGGESYKGSANGSRSL